MTKKSAKSAPKKPAAKAAKAQGSKIAKTQLVELVADKTTLNKKQATEAVETALDCIITALKQGKSVGLPGLGTLSVRNTAERTGVRPGTNEKITVPAGKKVGFKVATTLKGTL